jgi:hypothetical protein
MNIIPPNDTKFVLILRLLLHKLGEIMLCKKIQIY